MSRLIDGKAVARIINEQTALNVASLLDDGIFPTLAVVVPTTDPGTAWYVRSIARAADRLGIRCLIEQLDEPSPTTIADRLTALSADRDVHGVICQTPLPPGATLANLGGAIAAAKDVDGASPTSFGLLAAGSTEAFAPATAQAVVEILRHEQIPLAGRRAVVVGRSMVVGKPAAMLLLAENATVTVCHSRSSDLPATCREADVLVAAVGRPGLIGADHVRPGAVVIDVGTNPTPDGGLVGDVDEAAVAPVASALTPVPGGVGPVTTALLLRHTVVAAARAAGPPA